MSSQDLQGNVSNGIDRLEGTATSKLDQAAAKTKAQTRQFSDKVDQAVGKAKESVKSGAARAQAATARAADQASDTYEMLRDNAQKFAARVDPMVKEQPYAAMVAGVIIGLLAGALMFGGGAKVIYVRPRS